VRRSGAGGTSALAAALTVVVAGCADTVSPMAGGLRLGVQNAPLKPPTRVDSAHPFVYPPSIAASGASGTTVLRILISAEGTVDSSLVLESSGNEVLDSAAVADSRRLRWTPAEQGGRPIPIWGRLPVIYPRPERGSEP